MTTLAADKDPHRLRGVDVSAHRAFLAFEAVHGRATLSSIDEPITVVSADPTSPDKFRREADRIRATLPLGLVPDLQHIGSSAVPGLDGKPVVDIMVGLSESDRIAELVPILENLGYESLGEAGVPGRWALRRRGIGSTFNISIVAYGGARWRQNLTIRDFLISDRQAARRYAAAKRAAVARGAETLFAYSDSKRAAIVAVAVAAEQCMSEPVAAHVELVSPSLERLRAYTNALESRWSPDTTRDVSGEQLAAIRDDPEAFVQDLARREGGTRTLADRTTVQWLPGRVYWIWDDDFCGSIDLRFAPGTEALPSHISGHVSYAVVPWKRNRGYARRAICSLLPIAHQLGLRRVLISCSEDNAASRRVIEANGGVLAGEKPDPVNPAKRKVLYWVNTSA